MGGVSAQHLCTSIVQAGELLDPLPKLHSQCNADSVKNISSVSHTLLDPELKTLFMLCSVPQGDQLPFPTQWLSGLGRQEGAV